MKIREFPSKDEFLKISKTVNVIPVFQEIVADMETPVSILSKFYKESKECFLLESVEGGEKWGRYSIIGLSSKADITVFENVVEVYKNGKKKKLEHNGKPLEVLREIAKQYKPLNRLDVPKFYCGLVGYLTYEMVSFFEKIPNKLDKKTPLAHFIIPEEVIVFDNIKNSLTAIVNVFIEEKETELKKNKKNVFIEEKEAELKKNEKYETAKKGLKKIIQKIYSTIKKEKKGSDKKYNLEPVYDKKEFIENVKKTKKHILAGDIIQTVISQPFVCNEKIDTLKLYRLQRFINPSPYLFYMKFDEFTLVGSSPEVMVKLDNNIATLRPIAGTRKRGENEQEDIELADDLLSDEKERAEHLMLVDLGRNDLGRVAETGSVQVTELMTVERYSHVMHLVSNIICDIKNGLDGFDLIEATFPAGTLSGAPKIKAMEIIADLEKTPRGAYGGCVGYISFDGDINLAITIRTSVVEKNKLTIQAGAGIVADSVPENEHIESMNKAEAMKKALEKL